MMDRRQFRLIDRLGRALDIMGTHTVADVINSAKARRAQIWEGDDALVVTEINEYPLRRQLRYWCVAGGMDGVRALQPRIDAWATEQGCTHADAVGRRGWERVPRQDGWKHVAGYWRKELSQ